MRKKNNSAERVPKPVRLPLLRRFARAPLVVAVSAALVAGMLPWLLGKTPDSALHPSEENHRTVAINAYLAQADSLYAEGRFEGAILKADAAKKIDPDSMEARSRLGVYYARTRQYDKASAEHAAVLDLANRCNNTRMLAQTHANLSAMATYQGDSAGALSEIDLAIKLMEPSVDSEDLPKYYGDRGFILVHLHRSLEAKPEFEKAIRLQKEISGASSALITWYNGLGNVHLENGDTTEALQLFNQALSLALEYRDRVNEGVARMHIARCYAQLNNDEQAQASFATAHALLDGTGFDYLVAILHLHESEYYLARSELGPARQAANRAVVFATRAKNPRLIDECTQLLTKLGGNPTE